PNRMEFASVGNIEARVCGSPERVALVVRRGILGLEALHIRTQECEWQSDWTLVLHTDGLRSRWQCSDFAGLHRDPAKLVAERLMRQLATGHDDATVLVARCEAS